MELKPPPTEAESTAIALDFRTLRTLIESIQSASATARAQTALEQNEYPAVRGGIAGMMGAGEGPSGAWWHEALDGENQG